MKANEGEGGGPPPSRRTAYAAVAWELLGLLFSAALAYVLLSYLFSEVLRRRAALAAERVAAAGKREQTALPVVLSRLERCTIVDTIDLPGRLQALREVEVSTEVKGRVVERLVEEGERIAAGDPILRIDDSDYRLRLKNAEARLALASETLRTTRRLVEEKVESPFDLDKALSSYDQEAAAVERAKLDLERCLVKSPIDGVIDELAPETGEFVSAEKVVAVVVDPSVMKAEIGIPEQDVFAVRKLASCTMHVNALRRDFTGKVTFLSQRPAREALVYRMRLEIDNREGLLRPGMLGTAHIVRDRRAGAIRVPLFAVGVLRDRHVAYVVEPPVHPGTVRKVSRRFIETGLIQGSFIEVVKGLDEGDYLVVVGQRSVADGSRVRVVKVLDEDRDRGDGGGGGW